MNRVMRLVVLQTEDHVINGKLPKYWNKGNYITNDAEIIIEDCYIG